MNLIDLYIPHEKLNRIDDTLLFSKDILLLQDFTYRIILEFSRKAYGSVKKGATGCATGLVDCVSVVEAVTRLERRGTLW